MPYFSLTASDRLCSGSAWALRDWPNAPRNGDGTYDGRELVAWARDRLPRPESSDDDYERLPVIQEVLSDGEPRDSERLSIIDSLRNLRAKYGESVWRAFVDLLIREWADVDKQYQSEVFAIPSEADVRDRVVQKMVHWESRLARDKLQVATACELCSRLRRSRQWVKADPPEGHIVQRGCCPACY
ncbi:MAG: hypothetical protein GY842_15410 [bacterium]|nr:hypothetical protein [bacterium]